MPSEACTRHAKCGEDHENFSSNRCLQEKLKGDGQEPPKLCGRLKQGLEGW